MPLSRLPRRAVLGGSLLAAGFALAPASACAAEARVYDLRVSRDAGCGCCHGWTAIMGRTGRFRTTLTDEPDMAALKRRLGVPADLAACHTATIEGYVIEGHAPAADILRLVEERSSGVLGLAVAGMPLGSPGMEQPSMGRDAFDVIAFHADGGRTVFAHYPARA